MENKLRIVFFGTPEFAVSSLDILVKNNYDVAAVVTAPDKPAGGRALTALLLAQRLHRLDRRRAMRRNQRR